MRDQLVGSIRRMLSLLIRGSHDARSKRWQISSSSGSLLRRALSSLGAFVVCWASER